ncbi:MAG: hypothetical protein KZQ83_05340 [gamma proteobacterium symbiont of Taylorina sp.]|nr:hypothetical protein [gamma proteobacterium symbiont of Taylorina sp.]
MQVKNLEQSVPELFQVANKKYLQSEQAIEIIKQNIGVIPVANTAEYRVIWLDVGDFPYREWKFRYATQNLIEKQELGDCFLANRLLFTHYLISKK